VPGVDGDLAICCVEVRVERLLREGHLRHDQVDPDWGRRCTDVEGYAGAGVDAPRLFHPLVREERVLGHTTPNLVEESAAGTLLPEPGEVLFVA
jgi:hypothetical protein